MKYIQMINSIAKKNGFSGVVTEENVATIVKGLTESYGDFFAEELAKLYEKAANSYDGGICENSKWDKMTAEIDKILAYVGITTDYPGLYPTFFITVDGKEYNEYSTLNIIRRYNKFWG